jgi:tripartite-type tricarboxylate transporter receptor subunit TctC
VLAFAAFTGTAFAQPYPNKPVRLVTGFPAGGGVDATARAFAQKLSEFWGQNVIVDPRPGVNGSLGAQAVARAPKDGYTLFFSTPSEVALNPLLYQNVPYNPQQDFEPISLVAIYPNVIVVHPSLAVQNFADLAALSRNTPTGVSYATTGTGSSQHLAGEWLKRNAGMNLVHIPYKGAGPAAVDLVGGQVTVGIIGLGAVLPHINSGRLRAIAVLSSSRSAALPGTPTLAEMGTNFHSSQWYGVLAPKGTPPEIVSQVQAALHRASAEASVKEVVLKLGGDPATSSSAEYMALIRSEVEKYRDVIKAAGIKAD